MLKRQQLPKGGLLIAIFFLAGMASISILTSCAPSGSDKIGVILPLTGGAAAFGRASLNGMQLAIDEYNVTKETSEPQIGLEVEDDSAQPAKSVSAFNKLISVNHVRLLLGPLTSGTTLAVAPLAERSHVVLLSPGASAPALTNAGDYIFRDELSEAFGAKAQADLAFGRLGIRKMAMLYVNNEYGVGTATIFRSQFEKLGGRIVSDEKFLPGTTDFRTALLKIGGTNPDAIFVVYQDSIVNILRQSSDLGIRAKIYTTPVFEDAGALQALGPLAEGVIYTYYGTFDAQASSVRTFASAYTERFHQPPSYYAALGYDAARMMIAALRQCQFDQTRAKDCLSAVKDFQGVSGTMSFDQNGDVIKPVSLKIVHGGQFGPY